jgi:hypothetical protein
LANQLSWLSEVEASEVEASAGKAANTGRIYSPDIIVELSFCDV